MVGLFRSQYSCPALTVSSWRVGDPVPISASHLLAAEERPVVLAVDRRMGCSPAVFAQLFSHLSADEVRRYSAYRHSSDAELFLLGRSLLRILLAALSGLSPAELRIDSGLYGKPSCPDGPEFNVSHSADLVLIAIHPSFAVGVDVEAGPGPPDWESIAARVLPADVCLGIQALPRQHQSSAFMQAWCHLEARLKMVGTGFQIDQVAGADSTSFRQWRLDLPPGYFGSVAMGEV